MGVGAGILTEPASKMPFEPLQIPRLHIADIELPRDVKGLYQKARAGQILDFTGIHAAYEPPLTPDLHIDTASQLPKASLGQLYEFVRDAIAAFE